MKNFKIDKAVSERILNAVEAYFSIEHTVVSTTDIGVWDMELTNTEGRTYKFSGSLCSDLNFEGIGLSDLIRDGLAMEDLYVFDGKNNSKQQFDD